MHRPGFVMFGVPHAEDIQMAVVEIGDGTAVTKVPYSDKLVGDPETGVIHGGVITSLLDNACGVAIGSKLRLPGGIATLDLRIDYMKPATAGADVYAFTECYRVTKSIAFVRGVAYHTDRTDPIAAVSAAFMLSSSEGRQPGANLKASP
jgi:uncharacterized protein (TIGR00369 family)